MDHGDRPYAAILSPPFPYFKLGLRLAGGAVAGLDFLLQETPCREAADVLARRVCEQLQAYFRDPRHVFELPLQAAPSAFQQRVRTGLQDIPAGEVRSYSQLARSLNSAPRAVGRACRANPLPIIVPCHRVVSAAGALGGYGGTVAGPRLAVKQWLLAHEGVTMSAG